MSTNGEQVCYAITAGEYSSFFVMAIYTDKTLFDGYVELCHAAGAEVQTEEIPLNPHADVIRERIPSWYVTMAWDGNHAVARASSPAGADAEPSWNPSSEQWSLLLAAKTVEAAIKATNERRVRLIADGCPRAADPFYKWLDVRRRSLR